MSLLFQLGGAIVVFSIVIYPIGYAAVWAVKTFIEWQGRYR
ncbi:MAG: hypothetical protein V4510_12720 [bacterium]